MIKEGQRISSGYISLVAAVTEVTLWTVSTGKRAIIKKIMWRNRTGANTDLRIGYINVVAAAWVQASPDILMLNGFDGSMGEDEVPMMGNGPEGFSADPTALAGSTGTIEARAVLTGAAPNDVQVCIEVEEI